MSNENPIKVKLKPAQSIKTKTNNTYLWDPSFLGQVGEVMEQADQLVEQTAGLQTQVDDIQRTVDAQVIIINDPTYQAVGNNIASITTVGASIGNVNTVAQNITDITGLVADLSNVNTVAGDLSNINTVAGSISSVNTVAGNISNVNTVASDISRVGLVADDISSVHTVAIDISTVIDVDNNMSDINACATNMSDINSCASNMTAIQNAPAQATAAANSAQEAQIAAGMAKTNLPLLYHFWHDKIINDVCYLRADTFSWQSGHVYQAAFKHLCEDMRMSRYYITMDNGWGVVFYRDPEHDADGKYAWNANLGSILYTDKEIPNIGDNVYYQGAIADTVESFGASPSSYIVSELNSKKFYRDPSSDDTGYYAWRYNTSEVYYTTSETPDVGDDVYTESSGVYTSASTVAEVLAPLTSTTETISGHTITVYDVSDTDRIVLADQEDTVLDIYNSTGVAWYYILDPENARFKLPRTKYGFTGLRDKVGKYVPETLPNIKGSLGVQEAGAGVVDGCFYKDGTAQGVSASYSNRDILKMNASRSSSTYQDSAPVQQRATQHYLYFFVGNFTQTPNEQQVGEIFEELNGKADTNLLNTDNNIDFIIDSQEPTAENNYTWYNLYRSGRVEQGGKIANITTGSVQTHPLPITMSDKNYTINITLIGTGTSDTGFKIVSGNTTESVFAYIVNSGDNNTGIYWEVKGKADLT